MKTLRHRLDEACQARGVRWNCLPDEPIGSTPSAKSWGCIYQRDSGDVVALVTNASSWRFVLRRLLLSANTPPPVVRAVHDAVVTALPSDREVVLTFNDGSRRTVWHPISETIRVGTPVRELLFDGHEGGLYMWGEKHSPHRTNERVRGEPELYDRAARTDRRPS